MLCVNGQWIRCIQWLSDDRHSTKAFKWKEFDVYTHSLVRPNIDLLSHTSGYERHSTIWNFFFATVFRLCNCEIIWWVLLMRTVNSAERTCTLKSISQSAIFFCSVLQPMKNQTVSKFVVFFLVLKVRSVCNIKEFGKEHKSTRPYVFIFYALEKCHNISFFCSLAMYLLQCVFQRWSCFFFLSFE